MDFYEILGVSRTASKSEIQSAYRRLCKKYHPDVMQGDSETARELAAEKFREIHEAASVLLDDEQRKMYDDASETGNEESSEMSDGESDTDVNHDSWYRFCEIVGWILGYIIWWNDCRAAAIAGSRNARKELINKYFEEYIDEENDETEAEVKAIREVDYYIKRKKSE